MKAIRNVTIYGCGYCQRKFLTVAEAKKHEQQCKMNIIKPYKMKFKKVL